MVHEPVPEAKGVWAAGESGWALESAFGHCVGVTGGSNSCSALINAAPNFCFSCFLRFGLVHHHLRQIPQLLRKSANEIASDWSRPRTPANATHWYLNAQGLLHLSCLFLDQNAVTNWYWYFTNFIVHPTPFPIVVVANSRDFSTVNTSANKHVFHL